MVSPKSRILGGRYRYNENALLGEGSFAKVYKGVDNEAGDHVALKVYLVADQQSLDQFMRTVNVWNKITESADALHKCSDTHWNRQQSCDHRIIMGEMKRNLGADNLDNAIFSELVACMDIRRCFVQLFDYSKDEDQQPGIEQKSGELWVAQELGMESLEEEIEARKEQKKPMGAQDLLNLAWSLVCITWGLHMCGFVHMDIKPMNIVKFETECEDSDDGETHIEWKLIDLDGAMLCHELVRRDSGKYCFTPLFMPPELAKLMLDTTPTVKASRLMDVWSVGMCIMSAIFEMPILQPWYEEWSAETGSDFKFFEWLGDYQTEPIVHGDMERHLRNIDPGLNMILKHMLRKDPKQRYCSARCLMHPAFKRHRVHLLKADSALQEWMSVRKSDGSNCGQYFGETLTNGEERTRRRSKACSVM